MRTRKANIYLYMYVSLYQFDIIAV